MTRQFNLHFKSFSLDFWEVILILTLPEKVDEKFFYKFFLINRLYFFNEYFKGNREGGFGRQGGNNGGGGNQGPMRNNRNDRQRPY